MPEHATAGHGAAFLTHIQLALEAMPQTQRRIGRFAIDHPLQAAGMTITELARHSETSATTVTRFYRALGLTNYARLRLELASAAQDRQQDLRGELIGDIQPGDDLGEVVQQMGAAYARMITESARMLDIDSLERTVDGMLAAGTVRVFGMGGGGAVARYLQGKLRSLDVPAIAFRDPREAIIDIANADLGDVLIVVSQSGVAEDADHVLAAALARGSLTVALTADLASPVARRVDAVLRSVVREESFRTGTLSARHVESWIIDCLCTGILLRRYDESSAALSRVNEALASVPRATR